MAYTRDDYIKDLYIAEHSSDSSERSNAKFRAELFERGRVNVIEKGFKEFEDQMPISDYEMAIWSCIAVSDAANELFSDTTDRIHFVSFLRDRYNGLEDYDENERPLIRQIRNRAADAYHLEKIMYSPSSQGHFSEMKKSRDDYVNSLIPLMRKYKEEYYDKKASGKSSGEDDGGAGCAVALIAVILLLIVLIRGCVG